MNTDNIDPDCIIREWGEYKYLSPETQLGDSDSSDTKVRLKQLLVSPGKSISKQSHSNRTEIWTILEGTGIVEIGGTIKIVSPGDIICIPPKTIHRVTSASNGSLLIKELWVGDYLSETDITRW